MFQDLARLKEGYLTVGLGCWVLPTQGIYNRPGLYSKYFMVHNTSLFCCIWAMHYLQFSIVYVLKG